MTVCPRSPSLWMNRTVGLLGGSFNPAHEGHRHISLYALKMLGLDAVWWLVSPQNPLKSEKDMAPLAKRLAGAKEIGRHPKIFPTDIEQHLHTRYTVDTLKALQARFPQTKFVWLMGTDNLHQVHLWKMWEEIFFSVPVCVLDRPPRGNSLKTCTAAERFKSARIPESYAPSLKALPVPAWTVLHIPLNELSATAIRKNAK